MNRPERIKSQLGMPHGTANNKLRKSIMFKYVVLAGDNFCYKCGSEIESVDDISIEDKEPWEGRDGELFWNLDNIAFSHLSCNLKRHAFGRTEKTCKRCGKTKPIEDFLFQSLTCKSCYNYFRRGNKNRTLRTGIKVVDGNLECKSCGQSKPTSMFHKNCDSSTGCQSVCKECANKRARDYYTNKHRQES